MSIAPTPKSALDVARDYCGKNPAALPAGRYKVNPLPDGPAFDRLCRDIGATPARDMTLAEAEQVLSAYTRTFTVQLKRNWEVGTDERSTEWSVCCCPRGGSSFGLFPSTSLREAVASAIKYMRPSTAPTAADVTAQIDIGDGLGLEVPEPFCDATGPCVAIPPAKPVCLVCGLPTLGADECGECRSSRHNDDAAQRAAQGRADAEGGGA